MASGPLRWVGSRGLLLPALRPEPASYPRPIRRFSRRRETSRYLKAPACTHCVIDHNINNNHRLTLRANVSPSTITGIEVNGEDQPFGQNAYSRTSEQTYRDVAGVAQETWIIGNNKVNDFRFQYARRGIVVLLQHRESRRV